MVHFQNVPPGINQKFFKRWRLMKIVRKVGPLNLLLKGENKRETLIHVDRVRHAQGKDIEEHNDSALQPYKEGQDFYFKRGEQPQRQQATLLKFIPPEEREKDQTEYFFKTGEFPPLETSQREAGRPTRSQHGSPTAHRGASPHRRQHDTSPGRMHRNSPHSSPIDQRNRSRAADISDHDSTTDGSESEEEGEERRYQPPDGAATQTAVQGGWGLPSPWQTLSRALFTAPEAEEEEPNQAGPSAAEPEPPSRTTTRSRAREQGLTVTHIPLPTSSRAPKKKKK